MSTPGVSCLLSTLRNLRKLVLVGNGFKTSASSIWEGYSATQRLVSACQLFSSSLPCSYTESREPTACLSCQSGPYNRDMEVVFWDTLVPLLDTRYTKPYSGLRSTWASPSEGTSRAGTWTGLSVYVLHTKDVYTVVSQCGGRRLHLDVIDGPNTASGRTRDYMLMQDFVS